MFSVFWVALTVQSQGEEDNPLTQMLSGMMQNPVCSGLSGLKSLLETERTGCVYVFTHSLIYLLSAVHLTPF